jgi:hypothetical protein
LRAFEIGSVWAKNFSVWGFPICHKIGGIWKSRRWMCGNWIESIWNTKWSFYFEFGREWVDAISSLVFARIQETEIEIARLGDLHSGIKLDESVGYVNDVRLCMRIEMIEWDGSPLVLL